MGLGHGCWPYMCPCSQGSGFRRFVQLCQHYYPIPIHEAHATRPWAKDPNWPSLRMAFDPLSQACMVCQMELMHALWVPHARTVAVGFTAQKVGVHKRGAEPYSKLQAKRQVHDTQWCTALAPFTSMSGARNACALGQQHRVKASLPAQSAFAYFSTCQMLGCRDPYTRAARPTCPFP
jgi:hypothetical protein